MDTVVSFGATPDFAGVTSYVQGPPGDMLYMATSKGMILGWNEQTQSFTTSIKVGTIGLSSIDISPDGQTLIVGETQTALSPNGAPTAIDRIALTGGSVQHMELSSASYYEQGVSSVAYDAKGDMLIATSFQGSGWTPLHFAAAGSQTIGTDVVAAPASNYFNEILGGSYLVSSADHRYVFVMEGNSSDGPLDLYDTQAGKIVATNSLFALGTDGFNTGKGDVNDKTDLVVNITYNNIFVLDTSLKLVKNLSSLQNAGTVGGGHFDQSGNYLFLWNPASGHILAYDTQSWQLVGTIATSTHSGAIGNGDPTGDMTLSRDGRYLIVNIGTGFESIDLSTQLSLHITGDGTGTIMHGSLGADFFTAGTGPNTFNGEGGNDTAIFSGNLSAYSIAHQGDGSLRITMGNVTDTLIGVQTLQFQDVSVQVNAQGGETFITTAAKAGAWQQAAGSLFAGVEVADSAANVAANLDSLQSLASAGKLVSLSLTDSGFPPLSLSAAQFSADSAAIAAISGNYQLDISLPASSVTLTAPQDHGTTVVFGMVSSLYRVGPAGDGQTVDVSMISGFVDHLSNITAIQFSDQTDIIAKAPGGDGTVTTGNIAELYAAVLGREPDVPGLAFYEGVLKADPTTPFTTFAEWFLSSAEYSGSHSYAQTTAGETQFITDSYQNLLHRAPETGATPYYLNVIQHFIANLTAGTDQYKTADLLAHATMLTYFAQSPEFVTDVSVTAQTPTDAQHWLILT